MSIDTKKIEQAMKLLIEAIGHDPNRQGLVETPARIARFYKEFLTVEDFKITTFSNEGMDEMVVVKDIPFFSFCEHHFLPFFGTGTIAYLPDKKIVGLSKIPRILKFVAQNPQNQERITSVVAKMIDQHLKPIGVGVVLKARHLCMEMRGVKSIGNYTVTSSLLGTFKDDVSCRTEFLKIVGDI